MNSQRSSIAVFLCFAAVVTLATADARAAQRALSDQDLLARYTPAEIADYRDSIRQTFVAGQDIARISNNAGMQSLVEQRLKTVEAMSDADVARLMSYGADFARLRDSIVSLRDTLRAPVDTNGAGKKALSSGFPGADYDFCGSTHGNAALLLAAQVTLDVAKGIWSAASRACDQVAVVLGEGGNTSLLCIIVDGALTVAETTFNGVVFCENDIDSAEINGSYRRLAHIHDDIAALQNSSDSGVTTIQNTDNTNKTDIENNDNANRDAIIANDNSNRIAIITNSNSNRDAIVANDNANRNQIMANDNTNRDAIIANDNANRNQIIANDNANRDMIMNLSLRLSIEHALSGSNGSAVGFFQLPAPGGYLDMVRSIVRQTIDNMKANGQSVGNAESFYSQALTATSAGSYKEAFRRYQQAYQQATQ